MKSKGKYKQTTNTKNSYHPTSKNEKIENGKV